MPTMKIVQMKELRQDSTERNTFLIDIKGFHESKKYQTAGTIKIYPENTDEQVNRALKLLNKTGDNYVKIQQLKEKGGQLFLPIMTERDLLKKVVDLNQKIEDDDIKRMSKYICMGYFDEIMKNYSK